MSDYSLDDARAAESFVADHIGASNSVQSVAICGSEGDYRVLVTASSEIDVPAYPLHVPAVPVEVRVQR